MRSRNVAVVETAIATVAAIGIVTAEVAAMVEAMTAILAGATATSRTVTVTARSAASSPISRKWTNRQY